MTRLTPEIVKNTIVTVICVLTIVMLATALIVGEVNLHCRTPQNIEFILVSGGRY